MKVKTVTPLEKNYPPLLLQIADPPEVLYYIGDITLAFRPCIAVVGARKATEYGRQVAHSLSKRLAQQGVAVVSGMAAGIDTSSHRGAIAAGGKTIAVLGCGADVCYPLSNWEMKREIEARGLILSEQPPGYQPLPHTFPLRNRIISGISQAVVVVEAGERSGSLITAERAAEQGRNIYAVPGNITSRYSAGTNKLIADGAVPLLSVEDFLREPGAVKVDTDLIKSKLSEDERRVYQWLLERGETTLDELCRELQMEPGFAGGIITVLEIKGAICTSLGKIYIVK